MNEKITNWLVEEKESENFGCTEIISESDAKSEHSEHNTESEQSDVDREESFHLPTAPITPPIQELPTISQDNASANNILILFNTIHNLALIGLLGSP